LPGESFREHPKPDGKGSRSDQGKIGQIQIGTIKLHPGYCLREFLLPASETEAGLRKEKVTQNRSGAGTLD